MTAKNTKPAYRSKQIWGTVVLVLSAILEALAISANPDFLLDGFDLVADFEHTAAFVGMVGGALLRDYGQRNAERRVEGVVRDKN